MALNHASRVDLRIGSDPTGAQMIATSATIMLPQVLTVLDDLLVELERLELHGG